jgi:hypothetical protein
VAERKRDNFHISGRKDQYLLGISKTKKILDTQLDQVEARLDHMEKENERQHPETHALVILFPNWIGDFLT